MNIFLDTILLTLLLTSCVTNSNINSSEKNGILKNDYQLIWSETFTNEELDTTKWNIELRDPGWVNNELQAYTDKKDNIYIYNGVQR